MTHELIWKIDENNIDALAVLVYDVQNNIKGANAEIGSPESAKFYTAINTLTGLLNMLVDIPAEAMVYQ